MNNAVISRKRRIFVMFNLLVRRFAHMITRDKEVLNMQLVLIPILAKEWNKTYSELSDLLVKYDVLSYIDVCYENYNSTGNQGIINDLRDYIEMQGGKIS